MMDKDRDRDTGADERGRWIGILAVSVVCYVRISMPCSQTSDQDTVVEIAFSGNQTFFSHSIFMFRITVAFL